MGSLTTGSPTTLSFESGLNVQPGDSKGLRLQERKVRELQDSIALHQSARLLHARPL